MRIVYLLSVVIKIRIVNCKTDLGCPPVFFPSRHFDNCAALNN